MTIKTDTYLVFSHWFLVTNEKDIIRKHLLEWELKKETKVNSRFLMVKHSEIIWFLHLHIH